MLFRQLCKYCSAFVSILLFVWILHTVYNDSELKLLLARSSFADPPILTPPAVELYAPALTYKEVNQLALGNAERVLVNERVDIIRYNIMADVPKEMNNTECVFMKNPDYYICLHENAVDGISSFFRVNKHHWEISTQNIIRNFFQRNPEAMFIDVGCHIGMHTIFAALLNESIQVLAVEPFPQNVLLLHKSAHLNKIQDRITVLMAAVFNKRGPVKFLRAKGTMADGSLVRKVTGLSDKSFMADAILLDDLTPFVKKKKAFLKIDVEGSECYSFMNAHKLFDQIDIPYILMEIEHTLKVPYCYEFMLNFLNDRNYKAFRLPFDYDKSGKPLNYSLWKEWNLTDVIFKKFYINDSVIVNKV